MPSSTRDLAPRRRGPVDDPVANRVRARRLALGWSLKRLSEATDGLAPSFLFNIENGRKVPSEDVAVRIARALDDEAFESTYRAWACAKSRGRTGRTDHEGMRRAWEQLRDPFGARAAGAPSTAAGAAATGASTVAPPARDAGRLRVPVLAGPIDPGDGVRPPAERIANTLSLDPNTYGADAAHARARLSRLRRPFAFPLAGELAVRAGLPGRMLAIVTREAPGALDPAAVYVLREGDALDVARGDALAPARLGAVLGRIDLLLPDLRP